MRNNKRSALENLAINLVAPLALSLNIGLSSSNSYAETSSPTKKNQSIQQEDYSSHEKFFREYIHNYVTGEGKNLDSVKSLVKKFGVKGAERELFKIHYELPVLAATSREESLDSIVKSLEDSYEKIDCRPDWYSESLRAPFRDYLLDQGKAIITGNYSLTLDLEDDLTPKIAREMVSQFKWASKFYDVAGATKEKRAEEYNAKVKAMKRALDYRKSVN